MKKTLYILLFSITVFSCSDIKQLDKVESDTIKIDSPKQVSVERKLSWDDTLYLSEGNDVIVFGDSISKTISYVSIKFAPLISFSDFLVDSLYYGDLAPIDWTSNIDAKRFKTRISETYKSIGINFSGHYCFISWGCGSPCQSSVIVDAITGKIYDGLNAALGYDFKLDSRMIIVNPTDSTGYYLDCAFCKPEVYVFNEESKAFVIQE